MSIKNLMQQNQLKEAVEKGSAIAVTLTSDDLDNIKAALLIDCPVGKSGTPVKIKQMPEVSKISLRDMIRGGEIYNRTIMPSRKGDVIVFENAIIRDNTLYVGRVVTRVHAGMTGHVQVMRILAKPSQSSVTKKGITQFARFADPAVAVVVKNDAEMRATIKEQLSKEYPGGRIGICLRRKNSHPRVVMADENEKGYESAEEFSTRITEDLAGEIKFPIEILPIWDLPMGKEQLLREANPKQEKPTSVGKFGALYGKIPAFQPSIAIIGDEEEWAFGAPTGRTVRAVLGLHPTRRDFSLQLENLPSVAFNNQQLSNVAQLYKSKDDLDYSANKRDEVRMKMNIATPKNAKTPQEEAAAPEDEEVKPTGFGRFGNLRG